MKEKLMERASKWWNKLQPKQRKSIVLTAVCTGALVIALLGWAQSRGKVKEQIAASRRGDTRKEISIEPGLMEKKRELDSQIEVQRLKDQIEAIKSGKPTDSSGNPFITQQNGSQGPANTAVPGTQQVSSRSGNVGTTQTGQHKQQAAGLALPPLPPAPSNVRVPAPPLPPVSMVAQDPPAQEMGEISIISYEGKADSTGGKATGKKKESMETSVYLPPSYMEATLLSGAYIPTADSAKGNPMPVLLRVKTPAFLPNEARAAVKGCYIIADGRANLATERAELTVVSLSCLDRKGQAVIDQKVKGWLIDSDGVAGIGGKVVAKMGALVARSLVAGFFGGAGDALKATATTTSVSPLGTTQTIDAKDVAMAGAGAGISNGFKEIQKFYLELAKQTLPAIAILPSKSVTVAISEGVTLNIKPINSRRSNR